MAFSKIVITFDNWDDPDFDVDGFPINIQFQINGVVKSETSAPIRTGPGEFEALDLKNFTAQNYKAAWDADYKGTLYNTSRIANVVTIEANYDGAVFSDFATTAPPIDVSTLVTAVITNVTIPPVFDLTAALVEPAASSPCTTVKVTLSQVNGTPPYNWLTILPGNAGLVGANVPRSGGIITIEVEDDTTAVDTIDVVVPPEFNNTHILNIGIEGDPSGLYGTVTVLMALLAGVTYTYSLNDVDYQTSNVFNGILPGDHTLYVKDNFNCKVTQAFTVTVGTIRPPVYRMIPKSNSFSWFEEQAAVTDCNNPYNGTNAMPNNWKPTRWYNPKYFQPWCFMDAPITQFRSNYDTLSAELINIVTGAVVKTLDILQKTANIGQRQIMDAKIYDREDGQTGVYWMSGNIYDELGTVIGTYTLDGQLPEWAKVGQKFSLTGSAVDGMFEIKQIIFDSILLVNAAVIDRIYTDVAEPTTVKVDATYNRLNYEVYEFTTFIHDVPLGCYEVKLSMTDSEEDYQDSIWHTLPFRVLQSPTRDMIYIESSDHIDDGILYSTNIVHKQRFTGLFYEEDYPSNFETSRDSRKALNKLDGRVQKVMKFEAIDVPYHIHEKLALYISKKMIRINNLQVQFEEGFEVERNKTYSRVNLTADAYVVGYEQYMTNAYDIL
jgi:hypothetical protein